MTTEVEVLTRGQLDEVVKLLAKSTRRYMIELLEPIRAEIKELREELRGENERAVKLSDEIDAIQANYAGVDTQLKILDDRTDRTDERHVEHSKAWTDALVRIENKFDKQVAEVERVMNDGFDSVNEKIKPLEFAIHDMKLAKSTKELEADMKDVVNVLTGLDVRMKQIEERPPPRDGIDGKPGRDGIDGKDGAPGINGKDGRDGVDGAKGQDGQNGRDGAAGRDGLPGRDGKDGAAGIDGKPGRNGTDGLNGKDGAPGRDGIDGKDGLNGKDGRDGIDGKDGLNGKDGKDGLDGAPGRDGKDGVDGMTFDDVTFEQTGPRTVRATFARGDVVKTLDMKLSYPLYVGVYKHETEYDQGDTVTINGSMYVAMQDKPTGRPGHPGSTGWKLAVKNGRDGKDGSPGERGKQGEPGRAGRDLTSLAPDGRRF